MAPAGRLCAAVIDARRQDVYYALFRDGQLLGEEGLCRPDALGAELRRRGEPVLLAGDGALLYHRELVAEDYASSEARLTLAPEPCHAIRARYLLEAAAPRLAAGEADDLASVVPLYIRPSDARLPEPRR